MSQTSFQTAPLCVIFYKQKINDCTVKRKVGQQCNRRLLYQHIFYSDIQKKLRFLHHLNQFVKNIVQKLHKIFKISSETQMFRSNFNNSFLYMFRIFVQYIILIININETYIVLSNLQIVEISKY